MDIMTILEDRNPWWREPAARLSLGHPVRRDLQPRVLERIGRSDDRRAMLILGPRQVGKTTLLAQVADDLLNDGFPAANLTYFDFSDDRLVDEVSARQVVEVKPPGVDSDLPRVFLLDEISRSVNWDLWLKGAVDRGEGRIVATDSASSLLRDGGRESGQGRWDELRLEGLSFTEFARLNGDGREGADEVFARQPNLVERYLALGGFPEHARSDDPAEVRLRLRSDVVERAILRDLAGRVDDPLRVRDLFVYLMQESGGELNASNRGRDLGVDRRTVGAWVDLLEDTFLLMPLGREGGKASARLRGRPKLYAADHGLVNAFAASPAPGRDDEVRSKVFEAVVFRHLREVIDGNPDEGLSYLRGSRGKEVDFVVRAGGESIAVEVTIGRQVRDDKLAKLRVATTGLGDVRRVLVHGGFADEEREEAKLVPLATFLLAPEAALELAR
jgi:hypothetical protein